MINDENYICDNKSNNKFNQKLCEDLAQLKLEYEKDLAMTQQNPAHPEFATIKQHIACIQQIPMIRNQLDAAEQVKYISN